MFITNFTKEMFYLHRSKVIYVILGILTACVLLSASLAVNVQNNSQQNLISAKAFYNNDTRFNKDLHSPFQIVTQGSGATSNNAAGYAYNQYEISNAQLNSVGFSTYTLRTFGITLFVIVSAITGIYVAGYDYRFHTYKRRLEREEIKSLLAGKYLALVIINAMMYFYVIFLTLIIGLFLPKLGKKFENFSTVNSHVFSLSGLFALAIILFILSFIYSILWFDVNLVINKISIVSIIFLLYHLLVNVTWITDFSNAVSAIISRFAENVTTVMPISEHLGFGLAWIIVLLYAVCFTVIGFLIFEKYSRFRLL